MGKKRGKTLAIDFDGVIHLNYRGWNNGEIYGSAIDGAFSNLWRLHKKDYDIVIHSARASMPGMDDKMRSWIKKELERHFSRLNANFFEDFFVGAESEAEVYEFFENITITSEKVAAVAYIDDRAIRFTDWNDIRKYFI